MLEIVLVIVHIMLNNITCSKTHKTEKCFFMNDMYKYQSLASKKVIEYPAEVAEQAKKSIQTQVGLLRMSQVWILLGTILKISKNIPQDVSIIVPKCWERRPHEKAHLYSMSSFFPRSL